ncbi:hypothetical protein TcasGA2_TC001540 [Tribolium castaneum]|uniref:Uncharacterized protein n=1 Tax=Tribolium castaneum TaxID=7070 RepID=D7EI64_TRICA|nr:PREDICTED: uncharacterized protein LOC107398751 [Tribolium castaneum]EFA13270.1 hypothetical protein TcasGA2_TC001540 [Tribolium castaneum]|eukprot:XP_015839439.1 PREDICTED: uncharacterized protein LOC107398751 [Tribolium castaneum]
MKDNEAAIIIQKCVRRYLSKNKAATKTKTDKNQNVTHDEIKQVLEEIHLFQKKLQSNMKKKDEIKKLCLSIDEISTELKSITKLEHCKQLETSFSNETYEKIQQKHREQIGQINSKWWEKLDIFEDQ